MAEITQKLGYDVSQGVSALGQLRTALNQVNSASRNLSNLNSQFGSVGQAGARSFNLMNSAISTTVGFLSRDLIRSALRGISDLFREAAESAAELQIAVAEVSTISGGVGFEQLTDSVRALSNELGRPTVEVAEAAYQAFSNQVVQTDAELQSFIRTAGRLATATAAEQADAVGVLSSVINSYGENVSAAADISDDLFTIVEEGRTRLGEFANSLGTVTPLAAELGIEFNEVGASLAAITRSGTTTSVALTQIRGILNKLQKPTEALQSVISSLGARDFKALSESAGGLVPALLQIQQRAEELGITTSELFGRVRATAGALNLLRDDGAVVSDILQKLEDNAGAAGEAFDKIEETDARQAERALQRLSNVVQEFGDSLTAVRADFLQALSAIIPDVETLAGIISVAAAAAVSLGVGFAGAVIPAGALTAALGGLAVAAPVFVALGFAITATTVLLREQRLETDRLVESYTAASRAAAESSAEQVIAAEAVVRQAQEQADETRQALRSAYADQVSDAQQANDQARASFQGFIDSFVASRERVIQQIRSAIQTAESEITASTGRLRSITQQLDDIGFEKSIRNLSEQQQQARSLQRALRTAAESRRDLANAGLDREAAREAVTKRQRALEQLGEAERRAAATESTRDDRQVAQARERLLRQFQSDEKKRIAELKRLREDEAKTAERALQSQIDKAEQLLQTFKDGAGALTLSGAIDSAEEYNNRLEKSLDTLRKIVDLSNQDATGGFADQIGATDEIQRGNQQIVEGVVDFAQRGQENRQSLQEVLDSEAFRATVEADLRVGEAQQLLSDSQAQSSLDNLRAQLQTQLTEVAKDLTIDLDLGEKFAQGLDEIGRFVTGAEEQASQFERIGERIVNAVNGVGEFDSTQIEAARDVLDLAEDAANAALDNDQITQSAFDAVDAAAQSARAALDTRGQILDQQAERLKSLSGDTATDINNATTAVNNLTTSAGGAATAVGSVNSAAAQIPSTIGQSISAMGRLEQAALQAARAVAAARGGGGTTAAFFGRSIKRQTGGATRGQDSVLTATSPGEFVVNAKSARRFRSQLTAINAGQSAQAREQGGSVTNVGDISVNIQTPDAASVSGRSIARELNREIRTRGSKLFNS